VYDVEPERASLAIHNKPSRFLVLWDYFALEAVTRKIAGNDVVKTLAHVVRSSFSRLPPTSY
jgi:hypothetical protein